MPFDLIGGQDERITRIIGTYDGVEVVDEGTPTGERSDTGGVQQPDPEPEPDNADIPTVWLWNDSPHAICYVYLHRCEPDQTVEKACGEWTREVDEDGATVRGDADGITADADILGAKVLDPGDALALDGLTVACGHAFASDCEQKLCWSAADLTAETPLTVRLGG